jgi:hypothetical protein
VSKVTCDIAAFSISLNEFLKLISIQRKEDPDQESSYSKPVYLALLFLLLYENIFRTFDPEDAGHITDEAFRKIMKAKVPGEDVEEMLEGNKISCIF